MRVLGPTPADVLGVVAEVTGVPVDDICGPRTGGMVARARLVAYWTVRKATTASSKEIGRAMNRDHSSVMSGVERVEADDELRRAAKVALFVALERFPIATEAPARPQVEPTPAPPTPPIPTPAPTLSRCDVGRARPTPAVVEQPEAQVELVDEPAAVPVADGTAEPAWAVERACEWCETQFRPRFSKQIYCRRECADEAEHERQVVRWRERKRVG